MMSNKSKDEEINELCTRVAELEAEAKMGNIPYKEAVELKKRVAEQGQELEQKYDDDVDTYESLFLLGVDPTGKTTAECINELGEHIQSLESKLSTLLKASEGMEKALEDIKYHADNPFASKNGEANRKWLAYCQDVAFKALADFRALKEKK